MKLKKTTLHEDFTYTYLIGVDNPIGIGIFKENKLNLNSYDFEFEFRILNGSEIRPDDIISRFYISPNVSFDAYMKMFDGSILIGATDPNISLLETVESKINFISCKTASIEEVIKIMWNTITTSIMNMTADIENSYQNDREFNLESISTTKI